MTQRLQKDPGVADASVQPKAVERVGVVGAGIMGAGIAGAHVRRGIPVMMLDSDAAGAGKGRRRQRQGAAERASRSAGRRRPTWCRRSAGSAPRRPCARWPTATWSSRRSSRTKRSRRPCTASCKPILKPDAILASNTSTISITRMAKAWPRPENFAGMHFFNPVDRMQLVEVIRGEKTSDQTVATLVALAKRIGKTPIVVRDCPGFLVNRILFPYINESLALAGGGGQPARHRQGGDGLRHADGADHAQRPGRPGHVAVRGPGGQRGLRRPGEADAHPGRTGEGRPARAEDRRGVLQLRQGKARRRRPVPGGIAGTARARPRDFSHGGDCRTGCSCRC